MQALQRLVAERERRAKELRSMREKLQSRLQQVENDLRRVTGGAQVSRRISAPPKVLANVSAADVLNKLAAKMAAHPESKNAKVSGLAVVGSPRKRPVNAAPLRQAIVTVLQRRPGRLAPLKDITAEVRQSGYVSHSKKFENVVYQCLYNNPTLFTYSRLSGDWRLKST
jgi:hypothetical protein